MNVFDSLVLVVLFAPLALMVALNLAFPREYDLRKAA
jgi:hypothetical protein